MFDIGWTELLVIGVVALLVVGPKELPALLRTIGRYMGMIRRQANEFRAQFDEAMRETELDQLRKEVAALKGEAESSIRSAEQSLQSEISSAKSELDKVASAATENPKPEAPGAADAKSTDTDEPSGTVNGVHANGLNGSAEPKAVGSTEAMKSGT